ncbi:PilZ domain-containing protein [Tsuneonella sp. HG222]
MLSLVRVRVRCPYGGKTHDLGRRIWVPPHPTATFRPAHSPGLRRGFSFHTTIRPCYDRGPVAGNLSGREAMEERRDERHGITVPGRYRSGTGMAVDVTLRDLSQGGCQIHDRLGRLEVDQFVTIRIGPIGPIEARVRWLDGRVAGIRFDQPLAPSVLEHVREIAAEAGLASAPNPPPTVAEAADVSRTTGGAKRLDLLEQERSYNEVIGALGVAGDGEEILVGLDRKESEWLIRWRRERKAEREARPNFRGDKSRADRLEELHEQTRRGKLGY